MSRLYDTLRRMEREKRRPGTVPSEPDQPVEVLNNIVPGPVETTVRPPRTESNPARDRVWWPLPTLRV